MQKLDADIEIPHVFLIGVRELHKASVSFSTFRHCLEELLEIRMVKVDDVLSVIRNEEEQVHYVPTFQGTCGLAQSQVPRLKYSTYLDTLG